MMRMETARSTNPLLDGFTVSFDSLTIKRVNFAWSSAVYNPASVSKVCVHFSLFNYENLVFNFTTVYSHAFYLWTLNLRYSRKHKTSLLFESILFSLFFMWWYIMADWIRNIFTSAHLHSSRSQVSSNLSKLKIFIFSFEMTFLMLFLSNRKRKIIYSKFSLLLLYDFRLSNFYYRFLL